ncbi:MAG: ATP-binding cassette domain-containing protein, partial [Devosia sp.]|nr:ATP-binding cassette domain-containing protein [Devosia sp.]
LKTIQKPADRAFGKERFIVNELSMAGAGHFGVALKDITFSVRAGEIFGIAGVAGNGQTALLLALSGEETTADTQAINIDGEPLGRLNAKARRLKGLASVPEERNGHAAVPDFTLSDNSVLTGRDRLGLSISGFLRPRAARKYTGEVITAFAVKTTGSEAMAGSLSGGNLQKYIMGREILQKPGVLVVSQPTWGVDAGAAAAIHQALVDLAAAGSAIVVISQDLDELLSLCDTLAVINEGRLSKPMKVSEADIEEIGLLMGGIHGDAEATKHAEEMHHHAA